MLYPKTTSKQTSKVLSGCSYDWMVTDSDGESNNVVRFVTDCFAMASQKNKHRHVVRNTVVFWLRAVAGRVDRHV